MSLPRYFFECEATDESYQTDNLAEVMAMFNGCMFECAVYDRGRIIADQVHDEDEITGEVFLSAQIYTNEPDQEYVCID